MKIIIISYHPLTPLTYYPWITIDFIPYWILRFIMEQNPQGTSTHLLSPVLLIKIHVQHIKYPIYVWMDSKTSKLITNLPSFNHWIYIYIYYVYIYTAIRMFDVWDITPSIWGASLEHGRLARLNVGKRRWSKKQIWYIYIYTLWLFNVAMGNDP